MTDAERAYADWHSLAHTLRYTREETFLAGFAAAWAMCQVRHGTSTSEALDKCETALQDDQTWRAAMAKVEGK